MSSEKTPDIRTPQEIKLCVKKLEKIERGCRRAGDIHRAAMIRKAIAQLKMAQRVS